MYKASNRGGEYVKFEFLKVVSGESAFFQVIETRASHFLLIVANSVP